jgi:hypothetical protein
MTTIRTILTITTHCDWEIHQVDIKSTYLNATLNLYVSATQILKDGRLGQVTTPAQESLWVEAGRI